MPGGRREGERSAICAVTVPVLPGAAGAGLDSTRARLQRRVHPCPRQGHPDVLRGAAETRSGAPRRPPQRGGARPARRADHHRRRASAASRRCSCSRRTWPRPASRPTTRATSRFIPCAPTRGRGAVRPRRRRLVDLRRARGSRAPGAVYAENQALRWIADLAGLPAGGRRRLRARRHDRQPVGARRGPAHRPGAGTRGRHGRAALPGRGDRQARTRRSPRPATSWTPSWSGCQVDEQLAADRPERCARSLEEHGPETFFAVVATCGTTNFGDHRRPRLGRRGVPRVRHLVPRRRGLRRRRPRRALGAPPATPASSTPTRSSSTRTSGCSRRSTAAPCSTASRRWPGPRTPRRPATSTCSPRPPEWNPTDYSVGLTRRARGLPFWFSLAVHGTDAYTRPIERTLEVDALRRGRDRAGAPTSSWCASRDLSVVVFRRLGWSPAGLPGVVGPAARRGVRLRRARPRTTARR